MKRGIGYSNIFKRKEEEEKLQELSEQISIENQQKYIQILNDFRENFEKFIKTHFQSISNDPEFRLQILQMCELLSIDPLHLKTNFLSKLKLGTFMSEICTLILEICINTRDENGGICEMDFILDMIPKTYKIARNDVLRAVSEIKILGEDSLRMLEVNGKYFLVSNTDLTENQQSCLELATNLKRGITCVDLNKYMNWTLEKSQIVLNQLTMSQITWIDKPNHDTELLLDLDKESSENFHFWKENCFDLLNFNYCPKDGYRLTKISSSDQVLWKSDDTSFCSKVTVCHNNNFPVLLHLHLVNKISKEVLYFMRNEEESSSKSEDVEIPFDTSKWKQINFQQFYIKVNHLVQLNQVLKDIELSIRSNVDTRKIFVNNSCELLVDVYVPNIGFRMAAVRDGLSDIWRSTSPYKSCITVFIFPRTNYSNIHLVIEDRSGDVPTKTDLYFKRNYLSWQKISKIDYFTRFENEFGTTGLNREICDIDVDLYCYYYKYICLRMDEIDPDLFYIDKTYCDKVTNFAIVPKPGFLLKEVFVDSFLIKCSRNETVLYANLHFYQDLLLSFYLIVSCYGYERVLYFMKKDSVWSVVNFSQYISLFIHFSYNRIAISRAISISSTKSSSRSSSFNIVRKGSFGIKKKLVLRTVNIRKLLKKNGNLDDDIFYGKIFTSSFRNKDNLLIRTFFSPAENYSNPKKVYKDNKEKEKDKKYNNNEKDIDLYKSNKNVILCCGIGSSFKELFLSTNINKLLNKTNFVNLNTYTNFNRDGKEKTPKGGIAIKYFRKYSEMFNDSNYVNDNLLDIFKSVSYSGSIVQMLNKLGYNVYGYDLQSNGLSEGINEHKCYMKNYDDNIYDLLQFVTIVKNNNFFDNNQKYNSEEIFSNPTEFDFSYLTINNNNLTTQPTNILGHTTNTLTTEAIPSTQSLQNSPSSYTFLQSRSTSSNDITQTIYKIPKSEYTTPKTQYLANSPTSTISTTPVNPISTSSLISPTSSITLDGLYNSPNLAISVNTANAVNQTNTTRIFNPTTSGLYDTDKMYPVNSTAITTTNTRIPTITMNLLGHTSHKTKESGKFSLTHFTSPSRYTKQKNEYVLLGFSMGANICLQAIKLYEYYNSGGDPLVDKYISICGMYNITEHLPPLFKKLFPSITKISSTFIPSSRTTAMKHRSFGRNLKRYKEFIDPYYYIFKHRHLMCNQLFEACKNSLENLENYPKTVKTLVIHSSDDPICHINGSNTLYENIQSEQNTYVQLKSNYHQIITYEFVGLLKDIFQKTLSDGGY